MPHIECEQGLHESIPFSTDPQLREVTCSRAVVTDGSFDMLYRRIEGSLCYACKLGGGSTVIVVTGNMQRRPQYRSQGSQGGEEIQVHGDPEKLPAGAANREICTGCHRAVFLLCRGKSGAGLLFDPS